MDNRMEVREFLSSRRAKITPEKAGLTVFGGMIPSNHRRWCTKMLKLRPFEEYVGDDPVISYVGLRADEDRVGIADLRQEPVDLGLLRLRPPRPDRVKRDEKEAKCERDCSWPPAPTT